MKIKFLLLLITQTSLIYAQDDFFPITESLDDINSETEVEEIIYHDIDDIKEGFSYSKCKNEKKISNRNLCIKNKIIKFTKKEVTKDLVKKEPNLNNAPIKITVFFNEYGEVASSFIELDRKIKDSVRSDLNDKIYKGLSNFPKLGPAIINNTEVKFTCMVEFNL